MTAASGLLKAATNGESERGTCAVLDLPTTSCVIAIDYT